jgi:general nucleoside transport system ATP-binding protein
MEQSNTSPIVLLNGITCKFGDLVANDNVKFDLIKGEIHALLGENGAGKSTLMSVLYGLYKPAAGEILVKGNRVNLKSPLDAIELGIAMVHQHFLLTLSHTVVENIIVGLKPKRAVFLDISSAEDKIIELSKKYGLKVNPRAIVSNLSVGEQQRVEILKALYRDIDILILDEPTSMLTPQEEKSLFETLQSMVAQGLSIIFITHKLQEVMAVSTRVTVLRNGKSLGTFRTSDTNESSLAQLMIGRTITRHAEYSRPKKTGKLVLEIKNVSALNNSKIVFLKDLSMEIAGGEIFGIAGVDGNGQSELAEVISGLRKAINGQVIMDGRDITNQSPHSIRESGLAYIPEDRMDTGLILEYSVAENLILDRYSSEPYSGRLFLKYSGINKFAEKIIMDFDIRGVPGINSPVRSMSGGNLQKIVLGRELSRNPKVLIAHNPTRGLDIGATEYVHKQLLKQSDNGVGVLLISLDLDEILEISDRIAVLFEGKIMGIFDREHANIDEIGLLMGGKKDTVDSTKVLGRDDK